MKASEEILKTKWCEHRAMVAALTGKDPDGPEANCIGSACSKWRWLDSPDRRCHVCNDPAATTEPKRPDNVGISWTFEPFDPDDGEPACWLESDENWNSRRTGFCALAGQSGM